MEDGFSSYSSLYDTSSLLQFCNGERGRAGGRTRVRGPSGEGQAGPRARPRQVAPVPAGALCWGRRGRASPRLPAPGLPDAHPGAPGAGGSVVPRAPADAAAESARGSPGPGRPGQSRHSGDVLLFRFQTHICLDSARCRTQQTNRCRNKTLLGCTQGWLQMDLQNHLGATRME